MELLLAQPVPRWKLVAAHLSIDALTIPLLCLILNSQWLQDIEVWRRLGVLFTIGTAGYGLALWVFCRRDLPAPL